MRAPSVQVSHKASASPFVSLLHKTISPSFPSFSMDQKLLSASQAPTRKRRTWMFCFPVRWGVFILSSMQLLMGLIGAILAAIFLNFVITHSVGSRFTVSYEASSYTEVFIFALSALIAFAGIITAWRQSLTAATYLVAFLVGHLIGSIIGGIYAIVHFTGDEYNISFTCRSADDPVCRSWLRALRIVFTVMNVLMWLSELWMMRTIFKYRAELKEARDSRDSVQYALV